MQLEQANIKDRVERRGSCLCGAVRISIKTTNKSVNACHCNICRKWTGGPWFVIDCGSDIHFEGSDRISEFSSSEWAERGFCSKCGTHLFYRSKKDGHYAIPVGLLDDDKNLVFDRQIFIDEKPSFYSFANETENLTGAEVFVQFLAPSE